MANAQLTSWDLFVLRHQKTGNILVHFVAFLLFWTSPFLAVFCQNYWWLTGFFASGAVGAAGHYVFKDDGVNLHEATSSPKVVMYSSLMAIKFLKGSYKNDIQIARQKLAAQSN